MADSSEQKLRIFISYSRRDSSDFADELAAGLELVGFAPFLDRQDIAAGEEWEARLGGLIQQADTVVFVISPEAVKSDRCAWEVERAVALSKRVVPVIFKAVPDADIPEQLRRRQFVRFDGGVGITRPLSQLAEALRQDVNWIREHTRIGEIASRWEARSKPESLLLRGEELAAAQLWAAQRKPEAPEITNRIGAFLAASKNAEIADFAKSNAAQRRLIRMQGFLSLLLGAIIVGLVGWIKQSYIKEQWQWYVVTRPFMSAKFEPFVLTPASEHALKPLASFRECTAEHGEDYCPEMVVLPAGSFVMGSPGTERGHDSEESPQHDVTIAHPFAVAKFELTFNEWETCVAYGDCLDGENDGGSGGGRLPATNINWYDANQYVEWLSKMTGKSYRLLSQAEYEYATRAGTQTAYFWGDNIGRGNANCRLCGSLWDNKQTAPVGSFPPNGFGLYDMVGNVWEWVEDCAHKNYTGAPQDGSAWVDARDCNRVVRGGSWRSVPEELRSAGHHNRVDAGRSDSHPPRFRNRDIGFRVALTLDTQ